MNKKQNLKIQNYESNISTGLTENGYVWISCGGRRLDRVHICCGFYQQFWSICGSV